MCVQFPLYTIAGIAKTLATLTRFYLILQEMSTLNSRILQGKGVYQGVSPCTLVHAMKKRTSRVSHPSALGIYLVVAAKIIHSCPSSHKEMNAWRCRKTKSRYLKTNFQIAAFNQRNTRIKLSLYNVRLHTFPHPIQNPHSQIDVSLNMKPSADVPFTSLYIAVKCMGAMLPMFYI